MDGNESIEFHLELLVKLYFYVILNVNEKVHHLGSNIRGYLW